MNMASDHSSLGNNESNSAKTHQSDASLVKKNFGIICLTFALVFTSYNAVINLQSSINSNSNIGLYALTINSGCSILSCLFITNPLMFLCGYKWTMFVAQIMFLLFIAANIYPKAWLMYSVSALCGIFRAAFGTAQSAYIAALVNSDQNGGDTKSTAHKYYAIFFSALQSSQIWGNLISYAILQSDANESTRKNITLCGADYLDSEHNLSARVAEQIPNKTASILYITFVSLILISLILVAILLDQRRHFKTSSSTGLIRESLTYITTTVKQMKNPKQILLLPLPFLVGASEAFMFGIFTHSFITCSVGVQYIGLVMTAFGITACIFSILVAYVVKSKSRLQWSLVAFFLWYSLLIIMLLWKPLSSQIYILYILATLAGIASAIWGPLLSVLHGKLFPRNEEAAFSTMVLGQNMGNLVVYFYGGLLRVRTSIILQAVYLTATMISYVTLEIEQRHDKSETLETLPFALSEMTKNEIE